MRGSDCSSAGLSEHVTTIRSIMLRYNPMRHPVGIFRCGSPGPDSPVIVSGNYFHTVKRLLRTLRNCDCHLLVADSAGINVWCAAGVGDFNEHKISDAVNSLELDRLVSHRTLVLPQLAAVGIDLDGLGRECGFTGIWGPCSLDDLPAFLAAGSGATAGMRLVRFSLADRFFNALGMFNAFLAIPALLFIAGKRREAHFSAFMNFCIIFGTFLPLPGPRTVFPSTFATLVGLTATVFGALPNFDRGRGGSGELNGFFPAFAVRVAIGLFTTFMVAADMLGSTPWYKTTVGRWLKTLSMQSLFQPRVDDSCTGCGVCLEVCPKGVFSLRKGPCDTALRATADMAAECCECLACVMQCPSGAIKNCGSWPIKDDIKSVTGLAERITP